MDKILDHYIQTFEELKTNMKWKVMDKRILMNIASIYQFNQKPLNMEKFRHISEQIKQSSGLFSPLRSHQGFITAAMLDVKFANPEEKIDKLLELYKLFRELKFASGTFTYIAATVVLVNEMNEPHKIIKRTKEIYDGMKRKHVFLTSTSDYPLATLLALDNRPNIIGHIESFYEDLSRSGFRKGNDLQFLSHILALGKDTNKNVLINRAMSVMDSLMNEGIKKKPVYYPIIGMLALLPNEEYDVSQIVFMYEQLNQHKDFKWQKDMNVMIAASLFVIGKMENQQLAETSLNTILEAVLQAQQAVMIATIAASTTATNSGS